MDRRVKGTPEIHVTGPWYDVVCEACNESIMDGEFAYTLAEAMEVAQKHQLAHKGE